MGSTNGTKMFTFTNEYNYAFTGTIHEKNVLGFSIVLNDVTANTETDFLQAGYFAMQKDYDSLFQNLSSGMSMAYIAFIYMLLTDSRDITLGESAAVILDGKMMEIGNWKLSADFDTEKNTVSILAMYYSQA